MSGKALTSTQTRHAELVSASILRHGAWAGLARWTLKQVQGDRANTIFSGDKLLTAPNAGDDSNAALFAKLGLPAMTGEEPMRACKVMEAAE